jgi:pimeloyl-ACP methyl ester carboxylesterase
MTQTIDMNFNDNPDDIPLPLGVRSRVVNNGNGLEMHILEAGFEEPQRPCVLLLHGFPELAYSWRNVLPVLAAAGYYVVAPDQRGYGQTYGWDDAAEGGVHSYRIFNLMLDCLGLIMALGRSSVAAVVGHDFGSFVAAICALTRPDVFQSVVLMSAPFDGLSEASSVPDPIHAELSRLNPARKHYQWYFSTAKANADLDECSQGIHDFLRAYFHHKSADWGSNQPHPLQSWTASELAEMPRYYIMDLNQDMPATVAEHMPSGDQIKSCRWLTEQQLRVYSQAFERSGFQSPLNWYRSKTANTDNAELLAYVGRSIDVPACYIAGASDWGSYQKPGALETMQSSTCTDFRGAHFIEGAGHWVQQEQAQEVNRVLLAFLQTQSQR